MHGELIYSCTREEAIADGVLVDVTSTAQEAGFTVPVAVTSALWSGYIDPSEELQAEGQSAIGRLWDLLVLLRIHVRNAEGCLITYTCLFQMEPGKSAVPQPVKAHIGPGDHSEPVLTIMLPEED